MAGHYPPHPIPLHTGERDDKGGRSCEIALFPLGYWSVGVMGFIIVDDRNNRQLIFPLTFTL
jgi:hypothetical protein